MSGTQVFSGAADWQRLMAADPSLARAICDFNQSPADYLDASRRAEFFARPAVPDKVWNCHRSRRHLSRAILARIGAPPCLDLKRPEWSLALLPRERIDRLARHVAAALVGAQVRHSVSRAEVLRWREWLSAEAHEFALTRAGLLPLGTGSTRPAAGIAAESLGRAWITAASRRWESSIALRFALKLPGDAAADSDAIDDAFASRLVSSVLSIVEARWCSSFAITRN